MLARRHLGIERRGPERIAVDRDLCLGRLGLDVQPGRAGRAVERERQIDVAIRLHRDQALFFEISLRGHRHAVVARPHLRGPGSEAYFLAVQRHRRAAGLRGQRQPRPAAAPHRQVEPDSVVVVLRHGEFAAHLAVAFHLHDQLVAPGGERREIRRAASLLAVEDHRRAERVRLDRQRRILRDRGQRERDVRIAALACEDLALLAQAPLHLHRDQMLAGGQLALVGRAAQHRAVDEDVGVGGLGRDRERGRPACLPRQLDGKAHLLAAREDVDVLLGAAAVGRDEGDGVRTGKEIDRDRRLADFVVVDADGIARATAGDGAGDRLGRRIERDAGEGRARRAGAGRAALFVLRLDEILEGAFAQDRGGQESAEAALAALTQCEGFVAVVARPAREHERSEEMRGVVDPRFDDDGAASRPFRDRRVLDLARLLGLGRARSGRLFVDGEKDLLAPAALARGRARCRRGDQHECERHGPLHASEWRRTGVGGCGFWAAQVCLPVPSASPPPLGHTYSVLLGMRQP